MGSVSTVPTSSEWASWLADAEHRLREVYRLSPERLIAEYRREREITRGYHGREILELLQNAGDAAHQLGTSGKVRIVVTPHGMVMGNTGRPFDTGGVQSLMTANLSPKRQCEAAVIGDKGLGFRSILNWTHSPLITSGELGVAFLPGYAAERIDQLAADNAELARRVEVERTRADELIVPRLAFPQWVQDWSKHDWPESDGHRSIAACCHSLRSEGFDTAVGMPFHTPRAHKEAVQQVDELNPEFLLLVDSIAELELRVDGFAPKIWTCARSNGRATLRDGDRVLSKWTVVGCEGEVPGELLDQAESGKSRFQITLATPDENQASPGTLFCFFPTEVDVPLPLLVHATVELDETRKHLNDTRANRYILGMVAERIAETAEQQLSCAGVDVWHGCRLVTPEGSWGGELAKFGVPAALKTAASKKSLIPVLGGGYCSATEAWLPPGEDAGWWAMRLFPEMVALSSKEERKFAEHLEVRDLTGEEILSRLLTADHLTLEERALAIAGLIRSREKITGDKYACLLCDDGENPLPVGTSAILQPAGELPTLPYWATIRFLHPEMRERLAELLETSDSRELQQHLRPFGVVEYSLSALIRPVLAEANRQVRERPGEEAAIRKAALRFLWRVHQSVGSDTAFPTDATVKLLNQQGKWTEPKRLYLGQGYGHEGNVTQDLYVGWATDKLVAEPDMLELDTATGTGEIAGLLLWLGVARWPREIEAKSIDAGYVDAVKASLRYPVQFEDCQFDFPNKLSGAWVAGAKTLDSLAEILRNAPPEAVLAWLVFDPRAAAWMRAATEHGTLQARPPNKINARSYNGPVSSYTHWQIATHEWLPASDGVKRAPRKCLLGDRQLEVLFPSPGQINQVLLERYGMANRVSEAFRLAGVMPGLAQLGRDDLYRLLLEVPDLSPDGKAGRALCRWFVSNEGYVFGSAGPYQDRFFREGMVWGSKDGKSGYFAVTELRHVDQEGLPPALTARLPIADLPKRVGAQKVKDVLGIRPLDRSEIRQELISHRASPEQDNRAAWFDAAKPYIKRLRQTQTKQAHAVRAFERVGLVVCDELCVRMQYGEAVYDHLAQEGEWFVLSDQIYVRGDLDDSLDLLADVVGVAVASVFGMADGDAFAKILHCDPRSRSKLLKRMCGDDFHEEIEVAQATPQPAYAGPICPPTEPEPKDADSDKDKVAAVQNEASGTGDDKKEKKPSGVTPIPHVPQPPPEQRKVVVRKVRKIASKPIGARSVVDGDRCEQMAAVFEEQDSPGRYVLGVGHITGLDAPGFDLVSFDFEQDLDVFRNAETRDWSKVRRFIEVKGRSSSSAKIELRGNELRAAREYGDRYYLYRFFEAADGQFFVSTLQNPMNAEEAKATIIEVDLDRAKTTRRFEFVVEVTEDETEDQSPESLSAKP